MAKAYAAKPSTMSRHSHDKVASNQLGRGGASNGTRPCAVDKPKISAIEPHGSGEFVSSRCGLGGIGFPSLDRRGEHAVAGLSRHFCEHVFGYDGNGLLLLGSVSSTAGINT